MKKDRLLILANIYMYIFFLRIVWKSNTISKLGLYSTKIILSVNWFTVTTRSLHPVIICLVKFVSRICASVILSVFFYS